MTDHTANTRRHLGELGVLSARVEQDERRILAHAQKLHADVAAKIDKARAGAAGGGDAGSEYERLVLEHGRLERVIAQARQVLG